MARLPLVLLVLLMVACSEKKPAPPTQVYPPPSASVEAVASAKATAEIVIPANTKPAIRKLVEDAWPKVRQVCPGLDRYAEQIHFQDIQENFRTAVVFSIPQDARLPAGFMAQGNTCYFELAKDGSYVQIAKEGCKALCLGRPIEQGTPEDSGDLQMPL